MFRYRPMKFPVNLPFVSRHQEEGIDGGLEVANPSAHRVHQTGAQGVDASVF